MKPDYKNWVPKGMVYTVSVGFVLSVIGLLIFIFMRFGGGVTQKIFVVVFALLSIITGGGTVFCHVMYRAFDYNGKRQLSRRIIEGIADYVKIQAGGTGLDVGCGSGALTIACVKKNPQAKMIGLDRWGAEYASFSKTLCEKNARIEGVSEQTDFLQGDAKSLPFPDESFDLVTSNYVYHNIAGADKQKLLQETLRVLKKGGLFAIHDLMSKARYGDMETFVAELKAKGYAEVVLIDTTKGIFMSPQEARLLFLSGSTLLVGQK